MDHEMKGCTEASSLALFIIPAAVSCGNDEPRAMLDASFLVSGATIETMQQVGDSG
jgi:hypothetical protein